MLDRRERGQDELFVACCLSDLIPEDYILKRVDRVLDLSWLRAEVEGLYCADNGRPGIDPEVAVRLMLAGFFHGIVHDRQLMREARMHLGIRWFAGLSLQDAVPHHSSLTRLRQRWGAQRFGRIFERTVSACVRAGLVSGQTVHIDATLIRADVSWESLVAQHAEKVWQENAPAAHEGDAQPSPAESPRRGRPRTKVRHPKKRSTTDPDASLTTGSKEMPMAPCYKQHTAVDDRAGVILDAEVTTGETSEGSQLPAQLARVSERLGRLPGTLTADAGYSHSANYGHLEQRGVDALIPPTRVGNRSEVFAQSRFKYDARHNLMRCPAGRKLRRSGPLRAYHSRVRDCRSCPLRAACIRPGARTRTVTLPPDYPALLRARRRQWDEQARHLYTRHRWIVEGRHGEAKTGHGLARAVRRGLDNVRIQAYLTAAVMNLKRLAAKLLTPSGPQSHPTGPFAPLCRMLRTIWAHICLLATAPAQPESNL